jgi:hypothetical protein
MLVLYRHEQRLARDQAAFSPMATISILKRNQANERTYLNAGS